MKSLKILPLLLLLFSCSTIISPPDEKFDESFTKSSAKEKQFAYAYIKGNASLKNNDYSNACKYFKPIKDTEDFPLHILAQIKYLESCQLQQSEVLAFWDSFDKKIPRWALEYYVSASLRVAKKYKLNNKEAYFANRLAKYQKTKQEKIPYIKWAIKVADKSDKPIYENELIKVSPRLSKKLTKKNIYDVARDYEKNRDFKKARQYYKIITRKKGYTEDERLKAWRRLCMSHKLQRDRETFVKCSQKALDFIYTMDKPTNFKHDESIKYARSLWTIERTSEALEVLNDLLENDSLSDKVHARTHLAISNIYFEAKRFHNATDQLNLALLSEEIDKETYERVIWNLALIHYRSKHYQNAIKTIEAYLESTKDTENFKFRYWLAKSYKNLNKISESSDLFEEISKDDEFGYYGMVSKRELGHNFSPISIKRSTEYKGPKDLEWLFYTGETEIIQRYLKFYSYNLKGYDQIVDALPLFHKGEVYNYGIFAFYKIEKDKRNEALKEYMQYAFPTPFEKEISEVESRFKMERELIYSIIRQESAFDTHARSYADAFGLMQVIPEKAKKLSRKLKVKYQEQDDLYDARLNLTIGTSILKDNFDRYDQSIVATSTAYNAGDTPTKRWYKERYTEDPMLFIEFIPYKETRNYVKLIFRNYINYKRINSKNNFDFPEQLFVKPKGL